VLGFFLGLTQPVDGNHQVGAAVCAFLESAAHEEGIVGASFDAQAAKHAALQLDVEGFQEVFVTL
jgi:hypothetical protein